MMQNEEKHNFGFRKVTAEQKRSLVNDVFANVASRYDIMNDLMSFGIHRLWKRELCRMIPNLGSNIIDMAGGTGDVGLRIKMMANQQKKDPNIVVCDLNADMLKICKDYAIDHGFIRNFTTVVCDAEQVPFADHSFDYYTIAFGIRNIVNIRKALQEAYRVLKSTGKFLCLEFSQVETVHLAQFYHFYSFHIVPAIGQCVTGHRDAYNYLVESIKLFPNQEEFRTMLHEAGFHGVQYKNLTCGIAAIHYGFK